MMMASANSTYSHLRPYRGTPTIWRAILPAIMILTILVDFVTPANVTGGGVIGTASYGIKTSLSFAITITGFYSLFKASMPLLLRISLMFFTILNVVWLFIWLSGNDHSEVITLISNPRLSILSWLSILLIAAVAHYNTDGRLTAGFSKIPSVLIVMPVAVVSYIEYRFFPSEIATNSAAVAALFFVACRDTGKAPKRFLSFLLVVTLSIAMLINGYRLYAAAMIVFACTYAVPRFGKRSCVFLSVLLLCAPVAFAYVISNYGEDLSRTGSTLTVDTRSFLFTELFDDLSASEVWTGRGLTGRYYSPYFVSIAKSQGSLQGLSNINRPNSEVAWLNIILKFGLIGLAAYATAIIRPLFSEERKFFRHSIPLDGMRRFLPPMFFLFSGELPNFFSAAYLCFFIALGSVVAGSKPLKYEGTRSKHTQQQA